MLVSLQSIHLNGELDAAGVLVFHVRTHVALMTFRLHLFAPRALAYLGQSLHRRPQQNRSLLMMTVNLLLPSACSASRRREKVQAVVSIKLDIVWKF